MAARRGVGVFEDYQLEASDRDVSVGMLQDDALVAQTITDSLAGLFGHGEWIARWVPTM